MKRQLLTAMAVVLSVCGYAQTKGTNTLGFGLGINSSKNESNSQADVKNTSVTIGYGHFIKDNSRIGADFYFGGSEYGNSANSDIRNIGGSINYQHYYPLVQKLYAFAGGLGGYNHFSRDASGNGYDAEYINDQYYAGASGGISWFFSKRFAIETTLLNANVSFDRSRVLNSSVNETISQSKNFNLTTQGSITNLNFKIYLLF